MALTRDYANTEITMVLTGHYDNMMTMMVLTDDNYYTLVRLTT